MFAQDAWHATNRLTINAGVRGDMIQGAGKTGGNVYSSNNWAPRLGAALDVTGDNRTVDQGLLRPVLRGGADASSSPARCPASATTSPTTSTRSYQLTGVVDVKPLVPVQGADDIKHPRVDESDVGFERALSGTMRLSLHRHLARQQELRELGRPVRALAAGRRSRAT